IWHHDLALVRHSRASLGGNLELAEEQLRIADELDQQHGWGLEGIYGLAMFLLRRERGQLDGLVPMVRVLVATNPENAVWRPGLAALDAALDMLGEARGAFARPGPRGLATLPSDPN